jgi:hypothetical protein
MLQLHGCRTQQADLQRTMAPALQVPLDPKQTEISWSGQSPSSFDGDLLVLGVCEDAFATAGGLQIHSFAGNTWQLRLPAAHERNYFHAVCDGRRHVAALSVLLVTSKAPPLPPFQMR